MSEFDWKAHYLKGDISFADALHFYLQESGAPAFLLAGYEQALSEYQNGKGGKIMDKVKDLAEPFGIAMEQKEKKEMNQQTRLSHIRFHVDAFHEQGFAKRDPSKYDDTAFHKAGKLLHKSPSTIFDDYYKK